MGECTYTMYLSSAGMNWRAFRRVLTHNLIPMISVFWKQYSHLPYFKYILKVFYLFTPKSLFSVRSWSCQQSFSSKAFSKTYSPQSVCHWIHFYRIISVFNNTIQYNERKFTEIWNILKQLVDLSGSLICC